MVLKKHIIHLAHDVQRIKDFDERREVYQRLCSLLMQSGELDRVSAEVFRKRCWVLKTRRGGRVE